MLILTASSILNFSLADAEGKRQGVVSFLTTLVERLEPIFLNRAQTL